MFNKFRTTQYTLFKKARKMFIEHPKILISLEKYFANSIKQLLERNIKDIESDFNEASYLYPFWQNYPPDARGRKPKGDQIPWIEVGEHAIGDKLPRLLQDKFIVRDIGIPAGPDKRFVLKNKDILAITNGLTSSAWLFADIKSVGPRDDFEHTVMSHNQVSGDGIWKSSKEGVKNSVMLAKGKQSEHNFFCSIPPLYILSDEIITPVILVAIKPVYKMLSLEGEGVASGQPLKKIVVVSIPNGLLLEENPAYLKKFPELFFPGKDDKDKNPLKVRSRISFSILKEIDEWRVQEIII